MADVRELSERGLAAFNAHDIDTIVRMTHANCEFRAPGNIELRGREAIKAYTQNWFEAFPDSKHTLVSRVVAGSTVVVECIFEGTHKGTFKSPGGDIPATGRKVKGPYCAISRYEGELEVAGSLYYDQLDVLVQLGLVPATTGAR